MRISTYLTSLTKLIRILRGYFINVFKTLTPYNLFMCARFADDCNCKMHTLKIKKRMVRGGF